MIVRPVADADETPVAAFLTARWGKRYIMLDGRAVDAARLPGFLVEGDAGLGGLVTLMDEHDFSEIVTLDAATPLAGVGTALVAAAAARAEALGRAALKVRTTNDNLDALRFYQRRGFRIVAIVPEAIVIERLADPSIPEIGRHGIPIRDEIVLMRYVA